MDGQVRAVLFVERGRLRSEAAVANLAIITKGVSFGNLSVEIIDVAEEPQRAVESQIFLVPMLVRYAPKPEIRLGGDLSNSAEVRLALSLPNPYEVANNGFQ